MFLWHEQSGVSNFFIFVYLANKNLSCFCVFLFFSVFFFSSMYLWGDAGFWLGVGHDSSCDAVLPLDWSAYTLSVPTNQWLLSNGGSPSLLRWQILFLNLLTICFPQNVFLYLMYLKHVAVIFGVCVLSHIFSLPSPNVLCLFPIFFSQSLQWRDWKRVWWRTLATPLMKRKTTQLPKPQGQVTLGQFPLPPYPQAGHRAIAALLHPRLVLKHSHSHNPYHSGWHPKTGKHTQYFFFFPPDSYRMFTQTEPVLFHHSNS